MIKSSLAMLGLQAKDKITGFEGVVSSIGFDLYGCVQAVLTPPVDKDGKPEGGHWIDVKRLELGARVMDPPKFETIKPGQEIGSAEKPLP